MGVLDELASLAASAHLGLTQACPLLRGHWVLERHLEARVRGS